MRVIVGGSKFYLNSDNHDIDYGCYKCNDGDLLMLTYNTCSRLIRTFFYYPL